MNLAITSLPVPDSPMSRTVVSVDATCVAALSTACHASDGPTIRPAFAASSSDNSGRALGGSSRWLRPPHGPGRRVVGRKFARTT